ncbi:Hypothetical predicted protein [Paramuricea clavata]|uniref:Uncharacterized protein n=1 Tax=Paramuricea clavata TaxID=317549 RepID=A0A7D9KZX6_PARCT|nr:Hypothetical predicted protein [Paramuricea clavata]
MPGLYPLNGKVHNLKPGEDMKMDVENEGVPSHASEVIVYAKIRTGWVQGKDEDGELVLSVTGPNGKIERRLFCHVYEQSAWAYNSENISLPVEPGACATGSKGKEITATLEVGAQGGGIIASIQMVGYRVY